MLPANAVWSVKSLLTHAADAAAPGAVQPAHVARVAASAMLPPSAAQSTLQADVLRILNFTRAVQAADTRGVEPLLSFADEG